MGSDGATFAHEHADVRDSNGNPVFALPRNDLRAEPARARHLRHTRHLPAVGAVPRLGDDRLITVPFTVRAS
jgi:Cu+-exporting ATPase